MKDKVNEQRRQMLMILEDQTYHTYRAMKNVLNMDLVSSNQWILYSELKARCIFQDAVVLTVAKEYENEINERLKLYDSGEYHECLLVQLYTLKSFIENITEMLYRD